MTTRFGVNGRGRKLSLSEEDSQNCSLNKEMVWRMFRGQEEGHFLGEQY